MDAKEEDTEENLYDSDEVDSEEEEEIKNEGKNSSKRKKSTKE